VHNFRPLWVFVPLFCGRSHPVSPCFFRVVRRLKHLNWPLVASRGSAPNWGTGSGSWPWGAPPGGSPGPTRHPAPNVLTPNSKKARGGSWGGPWGGPGGVSVGPRGASGGVRGPLPGGCPPRGPLVAARPTDNTALREPPPRGAPPGGGPEGWRPRRGGLAVGAAGTSGPPGGYPPGRGPRTPPEGPPGPTATAPAPPPGPHAAPPGARPGPPRAPPGGPPGGPPWGAAPEGQYCP
jgi:hypothetical protein